MNNIKKLLALFVTAFIFVSSGFVIISRYIKRIFKESPQEAIQYNQKKVRDVINAQIKGFDIESIKSKKHLILERTIEEIQKSVQSGELSYTEITVFYLNRIKEIDQKEYGLNAIAEVNPEAVKQAQNFDLHKNEANSPLYGLPVTLKDNINTVDMPTSAGTYAFKDFVPNDDAQVVKNLRNANVLILAKVNLSELAHFMDYKTPSGYSSKVGQTRNPFAPLELSPSGSSTGSAVSIATNIGVFSIGTETTGSIIAPASIQSVVGMKSSRDSISREGVFPLSSTLDSLGPIARNVTDALQAYNSIVDDKKLCLDIAKLDKNYIKGKRIGIVQTQNSKTNELISILEKAGAEVVKVRFDENGINYLDIINNDFKFDFANFAKKYNLPLKNLQELIDYNRADLSRRARYGQILLETSNEIKENNVRGVSRQVILAKNRLDSLRERYDLDAFVFFNNESVILPAVAGYPYMSIPFGKDEKGIPQGTTFVVGESEEKELFCFGYAFEQMANGRVIPKKYGK
ncbi:hypothetical protein HCQ94_04140 [Actinomyces sp. zg-332]|uniref:amidase family protein n=1 Tax=Actinomyces sp. zg-332 TaxID=2708340 RepID=UPI0014241A73|nr:amidase family protein [Actinomyces sp. zg-332]QPK93786.1 hypothetical protein HCQ94_04140 [Actinomyces sp. zg-332]